MLIKEQEMATNGHNDQLLVPEPTAQFYDELIEQHHAIQANVPLPRTNPVPDPTPFSYRFGTRVIIWKQDPSVGHLGRRLKYLPGMILNGPKDARINTIMPSITPVFRNSYGDFVFPGNTPESDCAHTFAIVWLTLKMYERVLEGESIPWAWNMQGNREPIKIYPRAGMAANAYYSRYQKALKFFYFTPPRTDTFAYTCRSLDIVAHETGHAVLDGLKPKWFSARNIPQTGGLHESFGDLSALFLTLSDLDQVEAFIAMTKANLHKKSFLAALAEEVGAALGRPMGLRNADNNLKLSEVSNQVHDISQVFTGGIYDVLADIFAYRYRKEVKQKSSGHILLDVSEDLRRLLIDAIIKAPDENVNYTDIVNNMLRISLERNEPAIYRSFIRNRFAFREIIASPRPLTMMTSGVYDLANEQFIDGGEDSIELKPALPNHPSLKGVQDRSACCGTMQLIECDQESEKLEKDLNVLRNTTDETISDELILSDELSELGKAFK